MMITHFLGRLLRWLWDLLVLVGYRIPRRGLAVLRGLLLSARAWALFVLALIVLLIAWYALANRYTPYTSDCYVQAYVIQVAAQIDGEVTRVLVGENQTMTRGDLLFEIDPRPFEHRVANLEAKLAQAYNQVEQLASEVAALKAEEARLVAEEVYAEAVFKQEAAIFKQESTTERKYLDAVQKHKAAQAALERSRALHRKSQQAFDARLGNEHTLVAEVKAQLAEARLQLEWTRVRSPATGYVTNLQLRPGSYAHAGKPVLTCIDAEQWWVVANFRENCLERIRAGQPAGVSFNHYPGQVFSATVESVGWGVGEGQGVPSGELPIVRNPQQWVRLSQRFQVRLRADLAGDQPFRVGASAAVTIYTTPDSPLNPVAEAWQRVVAWFDFLY
jgi:multidrug resistance efflux pump